MIALIRKLKLALDVTGFVGSISRNGPGNWVLSWVKIYLVLVQITSIRHDQKGESLSNIISIIGVIQMVGKCILISITIGENQLKENLYD